MRPVFESGRERAREDAFHVLFLQALLLLYVEGKA